MIKKRISRVIYGLAFVLAVLTIIWFFAGDIRYNDLDKSQLRHVKISGTFHVGRDGEEQVLLAEALEQVKAAEDLTITGHFSENIEENEQIFIYLRRISIEVYKNGVLLYSYGEEKNHLPMVRSAGNVWCSFLSDGIRTEDELTIKFHNPYPRNSSKVYQLCMQRIYVGDKMQLFLHMAGKKLHTIIVCLLIFLFGIELLIISVTLRGMRIQGDEAIFHCGMLFLVSSIWLLIDYSYISLLFPYGMTIDVLDTLVFISIPVLALRYGQSYLKTEEIKWIFFVLEHMILLISGLYMVLQWFGIMDGEMMQELFMFMLPLILGIIVISLIYDIRKNEDVTARLVLISGIFLIISGGVGYICYEVSGVYGASLLGIGLTIFAFIQYMVVMIKFRNRYQEWIRSRDLEKELMESKIAIMLSQIQPHFLYNSISCIQELCLLEPKKAYDALAQFAHFLRGNMDSLTSTRPIPFEQELRHVKNYLALEKIRFEERLSVEYQIEEEGFFIPALTIQPIVENAVRYGISKKKSGGTVMITSRSDGEEIVVTVSDDGVGFDTTQFIDKKDGRSHVGMENVRNRLKSQCNGRLEVTSSPEGTTVRIILPKAVAV